MKLFGKSDELTARQQGWADMAFDVLVDEYHKAGTDVAASSGNDGADITRRYYRRYEIVQERVATGPAKENGDVLACREGCSHCCHNQVTAPAHELLTLAARIQDMPEGQRARVMDRVSRNAERVESMTRDEALRTPMRCALLGEDNACMAYDDRPSSCRRCHSLSYERCEDSFLNPRNLASRIPLSTPMLVLSQAQYLGFRKVLAERGIDTRYYEMNTGLREALSAGDACGQRLGKGEDVFMHAVRYDDPVNPATP
jgi:Fe-S-cluster containining protein